MKLNVLKLFGLALALSGFVACGKKDGGGGNGYAPYGGSYVNGQCMVNGQVVAPTYCNGNMGAYINAQGVCVNQQQQPVDQTLCNQGYGNGGYGGGYAGGYHGGNIYENNAYWGSNPYGYHPWVGTPGYFGGGAGAYAGYCYYIGPIMKCNEF